MVSDNGKSIIQCDPEMLLREVGEAEKHIEEIKKEIAKEWDNINRPVPVVEMVPVVCHESADELPSAVGS